MQDNLKKIPTLDVNGIRLPELSSVLSAPCNWNWSVPMSAGAVDLFQKLSACSGIVRTMDSSFVHDAAQELAKRFAEERAVAISAATEWGVANGIPWEASAIIANWMRGLSLLIEIAADSSQCEFRGGIVERQGHPSFNI